MDMTESNKNWIETNERHHQSIDRMLDRIRDHAVRISDAQRLSKGTRPFRTVLEMNYAYRGSSVEMRASIAWMPLHRRFEVSLLSGRDFEVIPVELPQDLESVFGALTWMSDNAAALKN